MSEPIDPSRDPFAPPKMPCEVQCVHCGESFESWQIEWRDDPSAGGGFWCCPTAGCDGVGFGFDIFPVDPAWTDENGEHLISQFSDDDEDEDDDEDDESLLGELDFDDDEDDEVEPAVGHLPVDVFDANAFWIDISALQPRAMGNSPQPPFNLAPPGKSSVIGEDDLPF